MGNLKNQRKYAPCCPIQHPFEHVEIANSFGSEGCVNNVITNESTRDEQLEGEDNQDDPMLLAWKEEQLEGEDDQGDLVLLAWKEKR